MSVKKNNFNFFGVFFILCLNIIKNLEINFFSTQVKVRYFFSPCGRKNTLDELKTARYMLHSSWFVDQNR